MDDILQRLRRGVRTVERKAAENNAAERALAREAADEIVRLRETLRVIELLTATGEGLSSDEAITVHALAAEGRADDPHAWRVDPAVIERARAALALPAENSLGG